MEPALPRRLRVSRMLSPWVNGPAQEGDIPLPSAEVKNEWSHPSTPTYTFISRTGSVSIFTPVCVYTNVVLEKDGEDQLDRSCKK